MSSVEQWFARKTSRRLWKLRKSVRVTEEWKRFTSRGHYAKVTLAAEPADRFSFESTGAWQTADDKAAYEPYVLEGILDELMQGPAEPVLGLRVVLESTQVHEIESNGHSFYSAARNAIQKITSTNGVPRDNCQLVGG